MLKKIKTFRSQRKNSLSRRKEENSLAEHELIERVDLSSQSLDSPILTWYFQTIPFSFTNWLRTNLQNRADSKWELNDELTSEFITDNIEYILKQRKNTKEEKKTSIENLLKATGIVDFKKLTEEIIEQIETLSSIQEQNERQLQSNRASKQVMKEKNLIASPGATTKQRSSTLI